MRSSVLAPTKLPLHLAISEKLSEQIIQGEYAAGEQLPSEHQLMMQFDVSRITVRRAIANLVNQGLVFSHRGKGVFVKPSKKVTRSLSNPLIFFDEDMLRQGVSVSIQSLCYETCTPAASVCRNLGLPDLPSRSSVEAAPPPQVYYQKKLILTDQVPVALDITYIHFDWGKTFADQLQSSLIYPTLDSNGVSIERIQTVLECTHAAHEVADPLGIPLGAPLLVNRYVAYTFDNRPVICGETLSPADRLCYSVVLSKRSGAEG